MDRLLLTRSDKNPILTPIKTADHWWEVQCVFNPGAVVHEGRIHLLYRAMGDVHYSTFGLAVLSDPETVEKRFEKPVFEPDKTNPYEEFGVEDARITAMDGTYYIVYNGPFIDHVGTKKLSSWNHMHVPWRLRCSMAETADFRSFKRHSVILPDIDSKDGVLFPEKIQDKYALLHRIFPDIYISYSEKLTYFDRGEVLCSVRPGGWDSERIGAGSVPIKTEVGWVLFYHGVQSRDRHDLVPQNARSSARFVGPPPVVPPAKTKFIYSLGILLLDLESPDKILYRSDEPILTPEKEYEKKGYVDNVVFTCGSVEWGDRYYVYYGAADTRVCVAWIGKTDLLNYLKRQLKEKQL